MNKKSNVIEFLRIKIAETLGVPVEDIQSNGNVHLLGLTSLNAVIISGEVEDEFQVEVDPLVMFENETIEQIADKILQNG